MMDAQRSLRQASRWKPWEPVLWLLAFAAPVLSPSHALIVARFFARSASEAVIDPSSEMTRRRNGKSERRE